MKEIFGVQQSAESHSCKRERKSTQTQVEAFEYIGGGGGDLDKNLTQTQSLEGTISCPHQEFRNPIHTGGGGGGTLCPQVHFLKYLKNALSYKNFLTI